VLSVWWSCAEGQHFPNEPVARLSMDAGCVACVEFSPDGKILASAGGWHGFVGWQGPILLWDLTGTMVKTVLGSGGPSLAYRRPYLPSKRRTRVRW
jgi:hypothetical protein